MRRAALIVFLVILGVSSGGAGQSIASPATGAISLQGFRIFANSVTSLPGQIEAIQIFRGSGGDRASVAVATFDDKAGWQVSIFDPINGPSFKRQWASGRLDDSFSVSDSSALRTFNLGHEDGIEFEGCAPHICPDVFSILLYVPSKRTAFVAKHIRGAVAYSPGLDAPENRQYKVILEQLANQRTDARP